MTSVDQRGPGGMSSISTMRAWPLEIKNQNDIPDQFKKHFKQYSEVFPYTVFIPSNGTLLNKTDEQLLSLYDDFIIVLENTKNGVLEKNCRFGEISYIESDSMLGVGRVKIYGKTPLSITFNSMGDKIFRRIVEAVRSSISPVNKDIQPNEEETGLLEFLRKSNLKYLSSAREILQAEGIVHSVLFQPEIRKKVTQKRGLKTIYEYLTSHVTILTSMEIIHVREERKKSLTRKSSYGSVSLIVPLVRVNSVEVVEDDTGMKRMTVNLEGTHNLEFHFDSGNEKVEGFAAMCSEFIKNQR